MTTNVLFVTGSSGIAEATALSAAREGWQVFIAGKEAAECASLAERIPGSAFAVGDLCEEGSVKKAFEMCLTHFGRVSAVFNVAGGSGRRLGDGPIHECTLEGWEATFRLNLRPTFLVSRMAFIHWLQTQSNGSLLNTSSVLAFSPEPTHFATHAYAAAKAAIISLSQSMAAQYISNGIRVNVLAPGLVRTPMSLRAQNDPAIQTFIETKQPLSHGFLDPEDIAQAALFLLSEKSRHITGQIISVDGGWALA